MNAVLVHQRLGAAITTADRRRLATLNTALISDSLERSVGAIGINPVCEEDSGLMAGTALTVRTRPGDNLAVHVALDRIRPGDVVVIDGRGEVTNALLGELMVSYARTRGVAGIVVDGAVRDVAQLRRGPVPVYARGRTHQGPYKSGPGAVHGAISVGGIAVHDGDVVVGDSDGVAFIPRTRLASTLLAAEAKLRAEEQELVQIQAGNWDRPWIAHAEIQPLPAAQ